MASITSSPRTSRISFWIGAAISALLTVMLLFSAGMKLAKPPAVVEGFEKLGWNPDLAVPIGMLELTCVAVYLLPRTSVLGAILLTGYLGGATATHVRLGDPFIATVMVGVLLWFGLFLRDARVRALIPLRATAKEPGL